MSAIPPCADARPQVAAHASLHKALGTQMKMQGSSCSDYIAHGKLPDLIVWTPS